MNIVVVIPAYNEGSRLEKTLLAVLALYPLTVVVDDGSKDDTAKRAREAGAYALRHVINRGQGAALQTGVDYAVQKLNADIVVHFDADGQMDPSEIKDMVMPILEDRADIVFGSRFLGRKSNMPLSRFLILKASLLFTWGVSGVPVTDTHCGFRVLSRDAALKARFSLDRFAHASQIFDLVKIHELRFVERPVTIVYTADTYGKGMHLLGGFGVLKDFFKHKFFGN
jgi:glycosyltransferase involved in cell wall biosynthesis